MKYLLDGYNVIGRANRLCLEDHNKVYSLANWLNKHKREQDDFRVILDGKSSHNTFGQNELYNGISLYYTEFGLSADQYIMNTVSALSNKKEVMVVSSDKEIIRHIKSINGAVITSDMFIQQLVSGNSCTTQKPSPSDDDVEFWMSQFNSDDA